MDIKEQTRLVDEVAQALRRQARAEGPKPDPASSTLESGFGEDI
jgi:hypothetical protein